MKITYLTKSPGQTKNLAKNLVKKILKIKLKRKKALILALTGDLGGGKTTFLKGLAKGLGIKEKILSPTFVIMRKFPISNFQFSNFYHIDCYRIEKTKEILNLDFKKIILSSQNIVAIEWAEKIQKIIPKGAIWINFKWVNKEKRKIIFKNKNLTIRG